MNYLLKYIKEKSKCPDCNIYLYDDIKENKITGTQRIVLTCPKCGSTFIPEFEIKRSIEKIKINTSIG